MQMVAPRDNMMAQFCQLLANIQRRVKEENLDVCIVITGYEGSGKSTLELILGLLLQSDLDFDALACSPMSNDDIAMAIGIGLYNSTFNPSTQVAFDPEQFAGLIKTAAKGMVIGFDEAANGLLAREAMSIDNRVLTTIAMVARAKNLVWILCIPNFHNLDHYFRQFRVLIWIHVESRGHALCHVAKRNPYSEDVWWQLFLRLQYPALPKDLYAPYDIAKLDYIAKKLSESTGRQSKRKAKEDWIPDA